MGKLHSGPDSPLHVVSNIHVADDGAEFTLREPVRADAKALMGLINSLVDEPRSVKEGGSYFDEVVMAHWLDRFGD